MVRKGPDWFLGDLPLSYESMRLPLGARTRAHGSRYQQEFSKGVHFKSKGFKQNKFTEKIRK